MTSRFQDALIVLVLVLLTPAGAFAQGTKADYQRAERLSQLTNGKVARARVNPRWVGGKERFWYRSDLAPNTWEFVLVDAAAGKRELAFDHAKLAAVFSKAGGKTYEATRLPIDELDRMEDGAIRFNSAGKGWRYDAKADTVSEAELLPRTADARNDAPGRRGQRPSGGAEQQGSRRGETSPDGKWAAVVKDNNLYLREKKEGGQEFQLSSDGTAADVYESGVYWSPDSSKLVAMRTQKGEDRTVYLIESSPRDQVQPKLQSYSYNKPGDKLAIRKPRLFDVASKKQIEVKDELFKNPWENSRLRWDADSKRFTFLHNQRGHQVLRVVAVDASSGEASALIDEQSKTFVDYAHKSYLRHVDEGSRIIWMSERDGWCHLYLIDAKSGKVINPITKGEWVVRGVDRVDEEKRQVWFRAGGIRAGQDPYYIHYCRVNFDGSGLVILTEGDGTHEIAYSPDGKYFVDTWSRVDLPPVTELRRTDEGALVCALDKADWSALLASGWQTPERFVSKARDGKTEIFGVIWRPMNFDQNRKYPVIEKIYAGPQGSFVPKRFGAYNEAQSLAELGFVVVQIDGMGTSNRSKAFHDVCWHNLGDAGLPDRIIWMKAAAAKYPYMDVSRVGVYGGSAGGQNSTGAVLTHGDFYKVAVSDCGCHDNRMDKVWWNELWMGYPVGPHYAEQSNVTLAKNLTGKLLLIVGELDRNVDPASTMQVVNALIKADKDFDLLIVPGAGHGAGSSKYGTRRRNDFFVRHLLGVEPRAN
jgi:dipeptidyl aminopeptidase/acylaminoacyl peptidase